MERNLLSNDKELQESFAELANGIKKLSEQSVKNDEELQDRISQISEILSRIKKKTDLINVQGNLEISIIEPASENISIRLKPSN